MLSPSVSEPSDPPIFLPARSERPTDSDRLHNSGDLLGESFEDFLLSRKVRRLSPRTIEFYQVTAGPFLEWLRSRDVSRPQDIKARHVRAWLAEIAARPLRQHKGGQVVEVAGRHVSEGTQHAYARAARAFLRFLVEEDYRQEPIKVDMPRLAVQELPALTGEQVRRIIDACQQARDKALVTVLVDTGLRLSEVCALDWGDIDLETGEVRVRKGKGGKDRRVIIGPKTRRSLLYYRRGLPHGEDDPVWLTYPGTSVCTPGYRSPRLQRSGVIMMLRRLRKRTGIAFSCHTLRRTFATLYLRNGGDLFALQASLGHTGLEMVRRYTRVTVEDLARVHGQASPVEGLR